MQIIYIFAAILIGSFIIMGLISIANLRFAPKFEKILANDKIICLIQVIKSSDDDGGLIVTSNYWLHIIDAENGKRLFKKKMGTNKMKALKLQGSILLLEIEEQDVARKFLLMDASTWKPIREYSTDKLSAVFTEFCTGVADEISYKEEHEMLKAYAKDGKIWYIDPFDNAILAEEIVKNMSYKNVIVPVVNLVGDKLKYIQDYKTSEVNKEISFIEGRLMTTNKAQKRFFILSYQTTDKTEPTLHCLSFDHKIMWEINPQKLNHKTIASKFADFDVASSIGDKIFYNFGGYIVLADIENGNIVWKNQVA